MALLHNSLIGCAERFYGFLLRNGVGAWDSESREAIEDGDADVNFRDLTVEIPRR